jgi:hypothetical protein
VLTMSIDRDFINQGFVDTLWKIVRDFSNMAFIFVLLYAGVQTILGMGEWKRTVLHVVIIALLINFSLFFTKVIIDAGNVLAVGIYSSMGVGTPGTSAFGGKVESRNLGEAVFIIAAIVSCLVAWAFFKAAMVFVGRILGFWFLMIVSPFAFISFAFPKGNKFDTWLEALIDQALVAPVFLFFMYMIMIAVQGGDGHQGIFSSFAASSGSSAGEFVFDKIFIPCIIALLIFMAIKYAVEYAEKTSGAFGKIGAQIGGAVMGVAAGGAGLIAQGTVGKLAYSATQSDKLKGWAAKSAIGRIAFSGAEKAASGTYDFRNAPLGDKLGIGAGNKGNFAGKVADAKKADEVFLKKVSTGKDGKPLMVEVAKKGTVGVSGESGTETITAAEAYARQLKKGYISRNVTGAGNIGATQAAESIQKKEKKRAKLAGKEKDKIEAFKGSLGIEKSNELYSKDLDSPEIEKAVDEKIAILEKELAKAEARLDASDKNDIDLRANLLVDRKKAEKNLKKFEGARTEIEKVQKELKEAMEDKGGDKKEAKAEKKEDKH